MSDIGLINNPGIEDYAKSLSKSDSSETKNILEYTQASSAEARMLSGPLIARFLQVLTKLVQAKTVLDVGTFTGYSALSLAESLPDEGRVYTCDNDLKILTTAQKFFEQSPNGKKIHIIREDALKFLNETELKFDVIFLDADKKRLKEYYEAALQKLNTRGALIIDDVLWRGEVLDPQSERAKLMTELNHYIREDQRVTNVLLPIRHGIQLIIKN